MPLTDIRGTQIQDRTLPQSASGEVPVTCADNDTTDFVLCALAEFGCVRVRYYARRGDRIEHGTFDVAHNDSDVFLTPIDNGGKSPDFCGISDLTAAIVSGDIVVTVTMDNSDTDDCQIKFGLNGFTPI